MTLTMRKMFEFLEASPTSRSFVEGERVANAGHVITVGILNSSKENYKENIKLYALCLQTSALAEKPHEINGNLELKDGEVMIKAMKCSCKAGLSERCKHIAAVLIMCTRNSIDQFERLSSTDLKCYWSKSVYREKYAQVPLRQYKCTTTIPQYKDLEVEDCSFVVEFLTQQLPHSNLSKQIQCRQQEELSESQGSDEQQCPYKNIIEHCKESAIIKSLNKIIPDKECCRGTLKMLQGCSQKISMETFRSKEKWLKERQFRITGSRCYSIYTYQGASWENKSQNYFWPKSFINKFVKHGRKFENIARQAYSKMNNVEVVETGLIVSEDQPWLGFSPDGIILDNNGKPKILLEIKCPFSGSKCPAAEFINNVTYLKEENSVVTLKKKHIYYGQVQLGMAMLDITLCHFILFSSFAQDFITVEVERDEQFCCQLLDKLQCNYFKHMIHVICVNENSLSK